MKSLQTRLLVGVTVVFAGGFLLAALAIYAFSKATMYAEFDEALFATAQALANLTEETDEGVEFELNAGFEEFSRARTPSYFQFWMDGETLARSARLHGCDLEFCPGNVAVPAYQKITLPDGRSGRQVCMTFQPKPDDWDGIDDEGDVGPSEYTSNQPSEDGWAPETDGQQLPLLSNIDSGVLTLTWERPPLHVTVAVARATTEIDRRLSNLLWILPAVGTAITCLSAVVLVLVVRNGLQPVQAAAVAITAIDENSLSDRVPTNRVPIEISPMVSRLNELLSRLEEAFHRERAFSANLAHELRTPLAGLKATPRGSSLARSRYRSM